MHFQTGDKRDPFCKSELNMAERSKPSDKICLDARAVRNCVGYGSLQLGRLEDAGKFPKRIHLGPCRVGWSFRDVLDWMQSKVDERPVGPMSPKVIIDTTDRFIAIKELRTLVLYSTSSVRGLELEGRFPGRIRLSDNRVVWLEREVRKWVEAQRHRRAAETPVRTYHVRLCRPRFEVATVTVKADSPGSAERSALATAKTSKSGWRLLPYRPGIYQPHVELSVLEETPSYAAEAVQDILAKYEDRYVRYLMLQADTNTCRGTVLFQPWFSDEGLGRRTHDLASGWVEGINRPVQQPAARRGRPRKRAAHRSR